MANPKITPQQAAQFFAQMTRQNYQMIPAIAGAESSTVAFQLPKVRLTSRVRFMFEATLKVTHSSATSYTAPDVGPFAVIRGVSVNLNNGFSPFKVSGKQLYMYSLLRDNASILTPTTSGRGKVVQGLTASSSGANNTIRFIADLPLTLNDRDPVSLILTQNQETTVDVSIDIGAASSLLASTSGYTAVLSNIIITPMVESFSIPAVKEAFPDLSVLKLVQGATASIPGSGIFTYKFPVGMTYRKIVFLVEDSSGGVDDADLTGDIELLLNQADRPYKINPKILAAINQEQFGVTLPAGMYAFDWSYQGIANYGGTRDYIDTERLTEFWLQFNPAAAGNLTVVYEVLSRVES